MQMLVNAAKFDWGTWGMGILGAVISGGSSAILTLFGTTMVAPDTFNTTHPRKLLEVMTVNLVGGAIISLAKFLQTHPTPAPEPAPSPQPPTPSPN